MTIVPLTANVLRAMPLPEPGPNSDKEARGRVLVIAGSARVPGAAILAGESALRAGAGKLQLAVPQSLALPIGFAVPESGVFALSESGSAAKEIAEQAAHADSVLLGPGMMDQDLTAKLARGLLDHVDTAFVLDAGTLPKALSLADSIRRQHGRVVLTPHAGEMAALLGLEKSAIEAEPQHFAADLAQRLNCIVTLKGATTIIASGTGEIWRNESGSVGLGTAGSGDVLAGLLAGLLARGASPLAAALWAVFVHARAGEVLSSRIGTLGFLAREIAAEIPPVLQSLSEPGDR